MNAARAITCPNCGGAIAVKAAGYSVSVGCQYCGALLDVTHPDVAVIEQYEGAMRDLALPLGRRGNLFGDDWEAIGALARSDGDAEWTETLLFNPYRGYRWLVLSEEEWTFGTMLSDLPSGSGGSIQWRGSRYTRDYEPAETTTTHVVGEFYWRVRAGDTVSATTYSLGNELLSAEWREDEVNWTRLVPIATSEITQAFALVEPGGGSGGGPRKSFGRKGTGQQFAAQHPAAGSADDDGLIARLGASFDSAEALARSDLPRMFGMAMATLLLSLLVMIGFGISTATVSNNAIVTIDGPEVSVNVGRITISRAYQPVTIEAHANSFENRWVDIEYTLVDRQTQRGLTAYGVVEHYAGADSDGPWAEGDFHAVTKFSSVPRGTYDVVADLQAHTWGGSGSSNAGSSLPATATSSGWNFDEKISVEISARAGGFMWGNLWLELALLLALPLLILWWRNRSDDD